MSRGPRAQRREALVTSPTDVWRPRHALFISHATPEDNRFTIWLGAKLTVLGYEVWSDLQRLRGGDDWERKLENAMRERAAKVLFVGTSVGASKQGVRNEITMAIDVSRKIGDPAFIIPLRLEPYDAPFLIVQTQYIDFSRGWAQGLVELLTVLDEARVPKDPNLRDNSIWRDLQQLNGTALVDQPEQLLSNWLRIRTLPQRLKFYDLVGGAVPDSSAVRALPFPAVPHGNGFFSFASAADLGNVIGGKIIRQVDVRSTDEFLDIGWPKRGLNRGDARVRFYDLARQAVEAEFSRRELVAFPLGSRRVAWWPPLAVAPKTQIRFKWGNILGRRQIQGSSGKRRLLWHYAVSASVHTSPFNYVQITAHVIFTSDGRTPIAEAAKMHRARRSFTKAWRNARWRDMLLAFLWWLSHGESILAIPVASEEALWLEPPPMQFQSPFSTAAPDGADSEDPDAGSDDLDDLAADDLIFDDGKPDDDEGELDDDY